MLISDILLIHVLDILVHDESTTPRMSLELKFSGKPCFRMLRV